MKRDIQLLLCAAVLPGLFGCRSFHGGGDGAAAGKPAVRAVAKATVGQPPPRSAAVKNPRGSAAKDPFQSALERIKAARAQPVPDGNFVVQVERVWFRSADSSSMGALFRYVDDHWNVQAGQGSAAAGFRVGVAKSGFAAALDGHLRSSRATSREQIMLAMMADHPASLAIGHTRYVIPFTVGGVHYALPQPGGQFVGTSLEAVCTPVGEDRVRLRLTPVFTGLQGRGGPMRVTAAATTVLVPRGQPLLIASQDSHSDSIATALLSRRTERGEEQAVLVVTVN